MSEIPHVSFSSSMFHFPDAFHAGSMAERQKWCEHFLLFSHSAIHMHMRKVRSNILWTKRRGKKGQRKARKIRYISHKKWTRFFTQTLVSPWPLESALLMGLVLPVQEKCLLFRKIGATLVKSFARTKMHRTSSSPSTALNF